MIPVVEGLVRAGVAVSVDTMKPDVMRAAIAAGASAINDVNAFRAPGAIEAVAGADVGLVAMHMQGTPTTMQKEPRYDDVVAEVAAFLRERARALEAAGVARDRIVLDPGFGFGKTLEHNRTLFRGLPRIAALGYRVLAGVSRKRMIGELTGRAVGERTAGSVAAASRRAEWRQPRARARRARNGRCVEGLDGARMRKYFGTDGVRGRVGQAPITPDFVLRLGYAAGKVLSRADVAPPHRSRPAVLIGKDTRISGYMLESALESGLSAAGVDTLLVGPMPTPGVAFLARALRLSAGIMISASHNPFEDNGIKFFSADGMKLPDAVESEIEALLDAPMQLPASSAQLGKAERRARCEDVPRVCKGTFPKHITLRGMSSWWTARTRHYRVGIRVFQELGAEVSRWAASPTHQLTRAWAPRTEAWPGVLGTKPISASPSTATRPPRHARSGRHALDGDQLLMRW